MPSKLASVSTIQTRLHGNALPVPPANGEPPSGVAPSRPDTPYAEASVESPLLAAFSPSSSSELLTALDAISAETPPLAITPEVAASLDRVLASADRLLGEVIGAHDLQPGGQRVVDVIEQVAVGLTPTEPSGTPEHQVSMDLQEALRIAEEEKQTPLTRSERLRVILHKLSEILHAIVHNDSDSPYLRWSSNVGLSVVRTGTIVGTATVLRQLLGCGAESLMQMHGVDDATRNIIGFATLMLGPCMILAGALRDEVNHTGTCTSLNSRMAMLGISAAVAGFVYSSGAMPQMASFGVQGVAYALMRDTMQAFFPIRDNSGLDWFSTGAGALVWSVEQIAASMTMDAWAQNSGAGYAMSLGSTFENCTNTAAAALAAASTVSPQEMESALFSTVCDTANLLWPVLAATLNHSLLRGVINAAPEVSDDLVRQTVSLRDDSDGLRLRVAPRVPTATNVADQFLTTSALRTAAMTNIYGTVLAVNRTFGDALPQGVAGSATLALVVAGACMVLYLPLIHAHDQTPIPTSYNMQPREDPEPARMTHFARKTSESAV